MAKDKTYKRSRWIVVVVAAVAVVAIIAAAVIVGCKPGTSPEATALMNRADAVMEARPDSALTLLESVDTNAVRGKADHARYALLMSMALDKNYVDTTTFAILQPAIDYYEKHGTPDERLKTRYYEGRIHMNRGEDDAALTSFLRAAEDSARCTDRRALARMYEATGAMYYKQYWMESYVNVNVKAEELYNSVNDTSSRLRCDIKILYGATFNNDTILARYAADRITSVPDKYNKSGLDVGGCWLRYYSQFGTREQMDSIVNYYLGYTTPCLSYYSRLDLADILDMSGHYDQALTQLNTVEEDVQKVELSKEDSIKYMAIAGSIYEHNSMSSKAVEAYKKYIDLTEDHYTYLFNGDLLFSKERHEIEVASARKEATYIWSILISIITLLVTVVSILIVSFLIIRLRRHRRNLNIAKNKVMLKHQNLMIDNRRISIERDMIVLEKQKAEQEKENLYLVSQILKRHIQELEIEKNSLQNLLDVSNSNSTLPQDIIKSRIDMLDDYIRRCITGNVRYGKQLTALMQDATENKRKFLNYITRLYLDTYPQIKLLCEKAELSLQETEYICLIVLGLNSKEAGAYLDINRINHFAGRIRSKIDIPKNESTLSSYIRQIINKTLN